MNRVWCETRSSRFYSAWLSLFRWLSLLVGLMGKAEGGCHKRNSRIPPANSLPINSNWQAEWQPGCGLIGRGTKGHCPSIVPCSFLRGGGLNREGEGAFTSAVWFTKTQNPLSITKCTPFLPFSHSEADLEWSKQGDLQTKYCHLSLMGRNRTYFWGIMRKMHTALVHTAASFKPANTQPATLQHLSH